MREQLPKEGKKLEWRLHIVSEMTFDNYAACVKTWNFAIRKTTFKNVLYVFCTIPAKSMLKINIDEYFIYYYLFYLLFYLLLFYFIKNFLN